MEGHELEAFWSAKTALSQKLIKRIYAEFNNQEALEKLDNFLQSVNYWRKFTGAYNALYEVFL